jgi:tetratricopeptide (TPR) repeat protein
LRIVRLQKPATEAFHGLQKIPRRRQTLAQTNRGNARWDKGDVEGALQDYSEAIRLKPDNAAAFYNRALILKDKADPAAAIGDFQRYLDAGGGAATATRKK